MSRTKLFANNKDTLLFSNSIKHRIIVSLVLSLFFISAISSTTIASDVNKEEKSHASQENSEVPEHEESEIFDNAKVFYPKTSNEDKVKFFRNNEKKYSNGKIEFRYSPVKGTYCHAVQPIAAFEPIFNIEYQNIVSSYDIFPFKYEILNVVRSFLNNVLEFYLQTPSFKSGDPNTIYIEKKNLQDVLFSFYLLFLNTLPEEKEKIYRVAQEVGKDYYVMEVNQSKIDYIKAINNEDVYSNKNGWSQDDYELFKLTGTDFNRVSNLRNVYDYFYYEFSKHPELKRTFLNIMDFDEFSYWYMVSETRSYQVYLSEFAMNMGVKIDDIKDDTNVKQMKVFSAKNVETGKIMFAALLIYADLCNHSSLENSKDKAGFVVSAEKGYYKWGLNHAFEVDEEVTYVYSGAKFELTNLELLSHYGFFLEKSYMDWFPLKVTFQKSLLTKEKANVMSTIGVSNTLLSNFLSAPYSVRTKTLPFKAKRTAIDPLMIKALRIYYGKNPEPNTQKRLSISSILEDRVTDIEKWRDYETEMRAYSAVRQSIKINHQRAGKLELPELIQSLTLTRNYYKALKSTLSEELKVRYQIRRKILNTARIGKVTFHQTEILVDDKIQDILSDQIKKLKDYYIKA